MLQSKFKYSADMASKASKLAYKLKRGKKDKIIMFAVPIAIILMVAILIYDINKENSIVFDIILIVMLIAITILNLIMPVIASKTQAKYFKKVEEMNYDYFISEYNKGVFKEKVYKDNTLVMANEVDRTKLQNYAQFDHYLMLVFSNYAMLIFDLNAMQEGSSDELLKLVKSICDKKK